ncbi:hypothetical protein [Methylomonas sp. WH-1]|uniref:hypothetical protein n=2 Tax=Methylomonas TaxID=416 RepID=UPI003016F304
MTNNECCNTLYVFVFIVLFNFKKVIAMAFLTKVLNKNVKHPFCSWKTACLNSEAFSHINGAGPFEEYTWNGDYLDAEPSAGYAENIHERHKGLQVELYEDKIAITLVKSGYGFVKGYMYPKEYFSLVEDQVFKVKLEKYENGERIREHLSKLQQLKSEYPKEIFNLIKKISNN